MLNHLGETEAAAKVRNAYDAVLAEGNPEHLTRDIGGKAGTDQFTDALIRAMI